jgi:hypothetical protein
MSAETIDVYNLQGDNRLHRLHRLQQGNNYDRYSCLSLSYCNFYLSRLLSLCKWRR